MAALKERPWLTLVLAWVSLSLVYSVALTSYAGSRFVPSLIWSTVTITIASLLGVGIWWLTARVPWPERLRPTFFLFHLGTAVANQGQRPRWTAESYRQIVERK